MSDSVQPHRRQPTRLPCPWDSPGKNTGVGCHFLLQCMKVKSEREIAQSRPTLYDPWTAAHQAPLSMGFSRQEYWSGVPLPSSDMRMSSSLIFFFFAACGVLVPQPGIEPTTPAVEAWSLTLGHQGSPFLKFLHPIFLACSILLLAQMYPQLETIDYAPLVFFLCPYSSIHIITNAS